MRINHVLAGLLIAGMGIALACGHETKSAIAKLEKDTKTGDAEALQQMAEAAWMYTFGEREKFTATKRADGKYVVKGMIVDTLGITSVSGKEYLRIQMLQDAKFMWRLFRGGEKRGLDEVVFSHWITFTNGQKLELYRMRLNTAQLNANVPAWKTADPYSVGEHDILDTDDAVEVEKQIPETWTVEVNNRDRVKIGG